MKDIKLKGFTRFSDDEFGINDLNYDQSEQIETATFNKQNSKLFDRGKGYGISCHGIADGVNILCECWRKNEDVLKPLCNNIVTICKENVSSSKMMDNGLNLLYI